jgi:flavin reductase (DIM6/NTAB) family NADH-FMN oxidoreductase RutF
MNVHTGFTTLLTADRDRRDNYRTLSSVVLPRPIAFVSTISAEGVPNLAPFSFFNAVGANPPAVIFSPCKKRDGTSKDTVVNLRSVDEFVVNVVPYAIRQEMSETSYPFPPEIDEFKEAGFTPVPSRLVRPPRVAQSPVHMECKLLRIVPVGEGPVSAEVCIGEVLCFHVADDYLHTDGTVDSERLDLVGRLGGDGYSTTRDRFDLPRPTPKR